MAIKFLIDEQVNPRVASALRDNHVIATSIHELGLSNQGFQDEALLELAIEREETLLSLDDDFLRIHTKWQELDKRHFGIFYAPTNKFQKTGAIGIIVKFCVEVDTLIQEGAGTLEADIYNQLIFIKEA